MHAITLLLFLSILFLLGAFYHSQCHSKASFFHNWTKESDDYGEQGGYSTDEKRSWSWKQIKVVLCTLCAERVFPVHIKCFSGKSKFGIQDRLNKANAGIRVDL